MEELQARQYWRSEWRTDAAIEKPFDLGDASSLGKSLGADTLVAHIDTVHAGGSAIVPSSVGVQGYAAHRRANKRGQLGTLSYEYMRSRQKQNYRPEEYLVREVLTGLQGRRNMMFTWAHNGPNAFSFVVRLVLLTSQPIFTIV